MATDLKYKEVTEAIIGAAMTVLNTLRPGLDENLKRSVLSVSSVVRRTDCRLA